MTRKTDSPTLKYEQDLWQGGFIHVAGLDEAGRGALAGPVAVGAVILPTLVAHTQGIVRAVLNTAEEFEAWSRSRG